MISARPPNAPTGRPPPIIFPKQLMSGSNSEALLSAAQRQSEPGHHFIKNEQRAVGLGDVAEKFQEARLGQDTIRRCREPVQQ